MSADPSLNLAAVSWSGGKDSCLAMHRARAEFRIGALVTMLTEDGSRTRSHGLRPEIIERQAHLLGLPPVFGCASWMNYEREFVGVLSRLSAQGFTHVIFGDLMFEHHRGWTERVCCEAGLQAVQPVWGTPTRQALAEFVALGGEARIVTVRESALDAGWLGRRLTAEFAPQLERLGVDPCGENGEFHTLVTYFPGFAAPLDVREVATLRHGGCLMLDLEPAANS